MNDMTISDKTDPKVGRSSNPFIMSLLSFHHCLEELPGTAIEHGYGTGHEVADNRCTVDQHLEAEPDLVLAHDVGLNDLNAAVDFIQGL